MSDASQEFSEPKLQQAADLFKEHGSIRAAQRASGIPYTTLQGRVHRAAERGLLLSTPAAMPGFAIKSVAAKEGDKWVKQTKAPGEKFEIPAGLGLKQVSALTDGDGRVIQKWQIADRNKEAAELAIRTVVDELKKEIPKVKASAGPKHTNKLLLNQYTVTDLHFGMLAWAEETRGADYDLKIAEKLLLDWFAAAIDMAPNAKVGVFAQLGDLMHHDSLESVTPAHKHVLDADSRLQKIIRVVIRVVRQVIAMLLAKHEHVHVVMASANHDPASSAWMREFLHSMYEDEPRITVDNSPSLYYAYEHGKTALFYHHGHKRKVGTVGDVFVANFREMYGRCEYSYGHVGHLHSDEVVETNLMRIERHRTLAPGDAYAAGGGWNSKRDAKVITYHAEYGEVSRITLSPQMVQKAKKVA